VSSYYYKNKRRDGFIVAVAGVTVNFIAAFLFTGLMIFIESRAQALLMNEWVFYIIQGIIIVNLALMIFNLLPIPPLDGFNMLTELFDLRRFGFWQALYSNGFAILMVCIMLGVTGRIMSPALNFLLEGMVGIWASLFL
jgi:Zn-dependent protease